MKKDLLGSIISDIEKVKLNGVKTLDVDNLLTYLCKLTEQDSQIEHQKIVAQLEADTLFSVEMFRSVIDAGKDALRAIMIINGGAVVAIMALLGNLSGQKNFNLLMPSLNKAMLIFACGVLITAVAYGARYIAQFFYANDKLCFGSVFNILSVTLAILTYVTFGFAVYTTYSAFVF